MQPAAYARQSARGKILIRAAAREAERKEVRWRRSMYASATRARAVDCGSCAFDVSRRSRHAAARRAARVARRRDGGVALLCQNISIASECDERGKDSDMQCR